MMMSAEQLVELLVETEIRGENLPPVSLYPPQIPYNHGGKPETNCLRYGTAMKQHTAKHHMLYNDMTHLAYLMLWCSRDVFLFPMLLYGLSYQSHNAHLATIFLFRSTMRSCSEW
jgi:hypothetical protein